MTDQLVTVAIEPPVAFVTLNNPSKRNALSLEMMQTLTDALRNAGTRPDVAAIVLAGSGTAFSAGHDLSEMQTIDNETSFDELFNACVVLMQTIHDVEVPVIARVHGMATAAGCQLVAACDLAVCNESARFATPGVNIGLFCSTPMVPLSRAVGRKRALEMLLTAHPIDAVTALEWGLVNRVVPDDQLDIAVDEFVAAIARSSRDVVAIGKRAFWQQIDATEAGAYAITAPIMATNALHADAREGIDAFLAKRPPKWSNSRPPIAATS